MIHLDLRVRASGPKNATLAAVGMAPQKWELGSGLPFSGPSGASFNQALASCKFPRHRVYVTNLCSAFVDNNNLWEIPADILEKEKNRLYAELDAVKPNCLLVMGGDTLQILTGKEGIQKWR